MAPIFKVVNSCGHHYHELEVRHLRRTHVKHVMYYVCPVSQSISLTKPDWFLNQARASHRPARAWFLEIAFVWEVSMCVCVCVDVCVSAPKAMTN